ncbi:MAG: crotonase/enoyl-CoA hydratase family protein [Nannocystaceae bacterium]|nr:crotonase/enoyl-CoA hydratase family protein [Nannocystaceae bacterium]
MSDRVTIEMLDGGVADVRLNRADKRNALDAAMFSALIELGKTIAADKSVRAVVLSGEGPSFCAGLDFASFMASGEAVESMLARTSESIANTAQRAAWVWMELPVPVIAAVHGHAYGGGLQLMMGADIRFVSPDAKLSIREIQWGLVPDMSGTQTLRHVMRLDVLKELTWTGRTVLGKDSQALGLATHVSENPKADALALAQEIATKSPHAIAAGKKLLNEAVVVSSEQGLQLEEAAQRKLLGSPNQMEAVASNMAKRAPKFRSPS